MAETTSRLSEIEDLLRRLPAAKRATLLKSITELFVEDAIRYKPAQIKMFDSLFNELIVGMDTEILAGLSRRLAPVANSPRNIIGRLALSDDITIAEPVLVRSPCVEDAVLVDIARTKSQTHLLAIACRSELASEIVDLLITRGDEVAVRYVANNKGARISDASAVALTERAKSDNALAELIAKRRDIAQRVRGAAASNAKQGPPLAPAAA
jgi:uncharacterized protein (DUF2336 family)